MVVSSSAVVWHELECGSYRADLAIWLELAQRTANDAGVARVLDVGAGTGRVALELAGAGHRVTALDREPELLAALSRRAAQTYAVATGVHIETVCADARTFELNREGFDLCLLAMQTVQLFDGPSERAAFLQRARSHLRPGGLLAIAIVTDFEPFDCADGDLGPTAETMRVGGVLYLSRATRVRILKDRVRLERERHIIPEGSAPQAGGELPSALSRSEQSVEELDRLDAARLEREAIAVGLAPVYTLELPATDDHVSSTVVVLGA